MRPNWHDEVGNQIPLLALTVASQGTHLPLSEQCANFIMIKSTKNRKVPPPPMCSVAPETVFFICVNPGTLV